MKEQNTTPIALYGAESWGMRSAERIVNVLEMCFRSLVGVSRMEVGKEDVRGELE